MYTHLFFDVDDTLLDFPAGELYSLSRLFEELSLSPYDEVQATYTKINRALWDASERGEIGVEALMSERFTQLLAAFELAGDGQALDELFRARLAEDDFSIAGVRDMLERLHKQYTIAIATNGIATTQEARLTRAGLWPYIDATFVSNEIGVQKPDVRFFEPMMALEGFDKSRALMIGDSLTSDMEGARRFGMPRCWYNPLQKPLPTVPVHYIISDYAQLERLLAWQSPIRVRLVHPDFAQDRYFVGEGELPQIVSDPHEMVQKMHEAGFLDTTLASADKVIEIRTLTVK